MNMVRMEKIKSFLKTRVKSALGSCHDDTRRFGRKPNIGLHQTTISALKPKIPLRLVYDQAG